MVEVEMDGETLRNHVELLVPSVCYPCVQISKLLCMVAQKG